MSVSKLWDKIHKCYVVSTKADLYAVKTWMRKPEAKRKFKMKVLVFDKLNLGYISNTGGAVSGKRHVDAEDNPLDSKNLAQAMTRSGGDGLGLSSTALARLLPDFFAALCTFNELEELILMDCAVSDEVMEMLSDALKVNTGLTHLDLSRNNVTDAGLQMLLEGLQRQDDRHSSSSLQVLNLAYNSKITSDGAAHIGKMFSQHAFRNLKKLDLSYCAGVGARGMESIRKGICSSATTNLTKLIMPGTTLGNDGAFEVVELLSNYALLVELDISECAIEVEGTKAIANYLAEHDHMLEKLLIGRNYIGDAGLPAFEEMVRNNHRLKSLKMDKGEFSSNKFRNFLYALEDACAHNTSNLEELSIGYNDLGNDIVDEIITLISMRYCKIRKLCYDANAMDDDGAKKWGKYFEDASKVNRKGSSSDILDLDKEEDGTQPIPVFFTELTLKQNNVTKDGVNAMVEGLLKVKEKPNPKETVKLRDKLKLQKLDLRKNDIGVQGAKYMKEFFFKRSKGADGVKNTFTFSIFPKDVGGAEGINELVLGMRQAGTGGEREYIRDWLSLLTVSSDVLPRYYEEMKNLTEQMTLNSRESPEGEIHDRWTYQVFGVMDDPMAQRRVILKEMQDDDPWNHLLLASIATHTSLAFVTNARNRRRNTFDVDMHLQWSPWVWDQVEKGYTTIVSNALYRMGLLLDVLHAGEYMFRQEQGMAAPETINRRREAFWNHVIMQRSPKSEGLTMIEFCLKYGASQCLDFMRQLVALYPRTGTTHMLDVPVSATDTIGSLCRAHRDPLVRRWATAKDLISARYEKLETIYMSQSLQVVRCEDLFQTDEIDDNRYFYIRVFPRLLAPTEKHLQLANETQRKILSDAKEAASDRLADIKQMIQNEHEAFLSFEDPRQPFKPLELDNYDVTKFIHERVNKKLDIAYKKQLFRYQMNMRNNKPQVNVLKPYLKTLRQVLDNEGFAGEYNFKRLRHIAHSVALSLRAFNSREYWINKLKFKVINEEEAAVGTDNLEKVKKALREKGDRIHGNVKPRNIVLASLGSVQDPDGGYKKEDIENWVLTDFTRSVVHDKPYTVQKDSAYMAPEVARRNFTTDATVADKIKATEKMDVWSFGVVLYEMLTGMPLFQTEVREDTMLLAHERAELCNWVTLDMERREHVLRMAPEHIQEKWKESATNLLVWCLQGEPSKRPSFHQLMHHEFLEAKSEMKSSKTILDHLGIKTLKEMKDEKNKTKLFYQPQIHLVNCNFPQAAVMVQALEESFHENGCSITTDLKGQDLKDILESAKSARLVLCFLTGDCLFNSEVIMQLGAAYAEHLKDQYTDKNELKHKKKRMAFVEFKDSLDLGSNKFDSKTTADPTKWAQHNDFQYLCVELLNQESIHNLDVSKFHDNNKLNSYGKYLKETLHPVIRGLLEVRLKYRSEEFLAQAAINYLFDLAQLQPMKRIKAYKVVPPSLQNYTSPYVVTDKERDYVKTKPLYILPDPQLHLCKDRVYVLSAKSGVQTEETVSQLGAALETFAGFNKVRHDFNIKKATSKYLTTKPRISRLEKIRDTLCGNTVEYGKLIVVAVVEKGFYEKHETFLREAVATRAKELVIIPVYVESDKSGMEAEYETIMKEATPEIKAYFNEKSYYIPFLHKKYGWMNEASINEVVSKAKHFAKRSAAQLSFGVELEA